MKLGTSIRGRSSASNLSTNVAGSSVAFGWWGSLLEYYRYIVVMSQVISILLKIYMGGFVITVLLFVYNECTVHVLEEKTNLGRYRSKSSPSSTVREGRRGELIKIRRQFCDLDRYN